MRTIRLLVATALLALPLVVVVASPSGAQVPFEITGEATCNAADGIFTVTYTLDSNLGTDADIVSAELSGAALGDVTFSPDPLPADGTSTGSVEIAGDTTGTVTLTVVLQLKGQLEETFDLELAGDCEPPPTTTTTLAPTTTTAAAARPVTLQPAFTG